MIILGIIAALVCIALLWRPVTREEADATYYDDGESWEDAPLINPYFQPGGYYTWQHIEPFVWALGFGEEESERMYTRGYVGIDRSSFHAEFDATLGLVDRAGEPVFVCHAFDSHADTTRRDRWHRTPDAQALEAYR